MKEKSEAIKLLKLYLKKQGLNQRGISVCLDAINLSLTWKPKFASKKDLEKAEVFVSCSLGIGKRKDGKTEEKEMSDIKYNPNVYYPGLANIGLAEVILNLYREGLKKPLFAQWEVATALKGKKIDIKSIAKPKEGYLNTQGVINQFLENGLKEYENLALIVHPLHSYRARATIITAAYKTYGKIFQEILHVDTSNVCYDPDSVQPVARSEEEIIKWEIGSRTQHVFYKKTLDAKLFGRE